MLSKLKTKWEAYNKYRLEKHTKELEVYSLQLDDYKKQYGEVTNSLIGGVAGNALSQFGKPPRPQMPKKEEATLENFMDWLTRNA